MACFLDVIDQVIWPVCGKIDIVEAINKENKDYSVYYWISAGDHVQYSKNLDFTKFHTYSLQQDCNYIRTFVDGNKFYEMKNTHESGNTGLYKMFN